MSGITASLVKELRQKTGAGMMDCKKALQETDGSLEAAIENLRAKGLNALGKRAGKVAAEGTIGTYSHQGSQIVAIVELNCETDFVARGDDFQEMARDLAMHVAASTPLYLSEEEIPADVLEKEKAHLLEQLDDKQREMADKIIPGRIKKFAAENCFLEQNYVRDDSGKVTVQNLVDELSVKVGEKITVRRFQRFEVGEGIEKAQEDFAAEVAATIGDA